jgi:hypothetical protein
VGSKFKYDAAHHKQGVSTCHINLAPHHCEGAEEPRSLGISTKYQDGPSIGIAALPSHKNSSRKAQELVKLAIESPLGRRQ